MKRQLIEVVLVVLSLVVLYWPGIQYHWETSKDPYFVPYDASQYLPAFFKYDQTEPIPTTYAKEYYLNAICPPLYKWLTSAGARVIDVRRFQLGMMYLAYAVFLGVLGRLAWVMGGAALSLAVLAITISAWIFIGLGFIGGAPRMYAYPLMALILYSLILDRPYLLATTVVLGAWLYPMVGLIGGLCLAVCMLLKPFSRQSSIASWGLSRRLIILALTGCLTVGGIIPLLLDSRPYGRRVIEADIVAYPEAGPDGNYRPYDQLPYKLFGIEMFTYFVGPLYSHGDPMVRWLNVYRNFDAVTLLLVLAMAGFAILFVALRAMRLILQTDQASGAIRLTVFFVVCAVLHFIAWLAAPYLYIPTRYFMFSLPFLITLIFPWSLHVLVHQTPHLSLSSKLRQIAFLALIGAYLAIFGGRGNVGFAEYAVDNPARPLFDAIATLPKDSLIAGWPVGVIRKMEYVTRRNAFLTGDVHQVLHLDFMKVMRERMDAVFDAYLSTDAAPLYRLREEYGVTHLIVETRDFNDPKHPPEYFAPWRSRIPQRMAEIKGKEFLLNPSLHEKAAVFNRNGYIIIDLARLP